jgi:uncharacterized membrane protein YgdD (TMEM256/DUF423 family)
MMGVAIGAFAAHGLEGRLLPQAVDWVDTGARYQLMHAGAIVALALALTQVGDDTIRLLLTISGYCLFVGAALFGGVLYTMAFSGARWLGAVAPLGGLGMLAGWVVLIAAGIVYLVRS